MQLRCYLISFVNLGFALNLSLLVMETIVYLVDHVIVILMSIGKPNLTA